GIAAGGLGLAPDGGDVAGQLRGRARHGEPAVPDAPAAAERGPAGAADPDRRVGGPPPRPARGGARGGAARRPPARPRGGTAAALEPPIQIGGCGFWTGF